MRILAHTGTAACLVLALAGCSSRQAPHLAVRLDGQTLFLELDPADHLRYQTCDLFQGMDKQTPTGWRPLRDDLPGSYYQPSSFDGYILDGKFVEPSAFAGCDVVGCADLPDGIDVGGTVEYVATGSAPPPSDFVYRDPFVRPNAITVCEGRPLRATRVRTHVSYFTDQTCRDRHEAALEVDVP